VYIDVQSGWWCCICSAGRSLLTPTRIYVESTLSVLRSGLVKAAAHITGGGLPGNIVRVLPQSQSLGVHVDASRWSIPPVFGWISHVVVRLQVFLSGHWGHALYCWVVCCRLKSWLIFFHPFFSRLSAVPANWILSLLPTYLVQFTCSTKSLYASLMWTYC